MDRLERQAMYHPKKPGEPGMQRREERWAVVDKEDCCFWECREIGRYSRLFGRGKFRTRHSPEVI